MKTTTPTRSPELLKSSSFPTPSKSLVQRKCACGGAAGLTGACSDCQKSKLTVQRRAIDRAESGAIPAIGHEVLPIQSKLTVGKPNDIYEQEADRVASQVLSMSDSTLQMSRSDDLQTLHRKPLAASITPLVQREVMAGNDSSPPVSNSLESRLNSSQGNPLPDNVRSFMEPRFGADFSQVRVHTGGEAVQMNRELNAQAFTRGQDIFFGGGKAPGNDGLTAHELTHVVHQQGYNPIIQRMLAYPSQLADDRTTSMGWQSFIQKQGASLGSSPTIYLCSKNLDRSPIGKHAFFRIGGSGKGNSTRSLEPIDRGADCWQGEPMYDFSADVNADANCEAVSITESCLESQFSAYPIGHYCTWGPNSNTFVGTIARNCGLSNPDPPGFTPGIDDRPTSLGTFAPSPDKTLAGCSSQKICDASRKLPPDEMPLV